MSVQAWAALFWEIPLVANEQQQVQRNSPLKGIVATIWVDFSDAELSA